MKVVLDGFLRECVVNGIFWRKRRIKTFSNQITISVTWSTRGWRAKIPKNKNEEKESGNGKSPRKNLLNLSYPRTDHNTVSIGSPKVPSFWFLVLTWVEAAFFSSQIAGCHTIFCYVRVKRGKEDFSSVFDIVRKIWHTETDSAWKLVTDGRKTAQSKTTLTIGSLLPRNVCVREVWRDGWWAETKVPGPTWKIRERRKEIV